MLTKEAATEQVAKMTDTELDRLADQVTGRHDDQDVLATAAVLERGRRNEQAAAEAQLQQRANSERSAAKLAYEQAGLSVEADPAAFECWFADRQRDDATDRLAKQRAAAAYIYRSTF